MPHSKSLRSCPLALLALAALTWTTPSWADVAGAWEGRLKCQDLRNANFQGDPIASFNNSVLAIFTQTSADGCCHTNGTVSVDDAANQFCGVDHAYSSLTTNAGDGLIFFSFVTSDTTCGGIAELRRDRKLVFTYTRAAVSSGNQQTCRGTLTRTQL